MPVQLIRPPELPSVVLARDVPQRQLRTALARGAVERIRPGAYLPAAEVEETDWQRRERRVLGAIVAVARQLPSEIAFSYTSAALIHGLWLGRVEELIHVTQQKKAGGPRSPGVYRHHDSLRDEDVTVVNGLRVTTIERTLTDCARALHPRDGLAVVDSGMRLLLRPDRAKPELTTADLRDLRRRLRARLEAGPPRGRRRARVVLDHATPFAESRPESILRWIAVAYGLPRPVVQLPILTRLGTFYVDLGWRVEVRRPDGTVETWLALVEYDGTIKYVPLSDLSGTDAARAVSDAVVAEKRREDAIREAPRTGVRRFEWEDLRSHRAALDRICQAFPPGAVPVLNPVPELLGGLG